MSWVIHCVISFFKPEWISTHIQHFSKCELKEFRFKSTEKTYFQHSCSQTQKIKFGASVIIVNGNVNIVKFDLIYSLNAECYANQIHINIITNIIIKTQKLLCTDICVSIECWKMCLLLMRTLITNITECFTIKTSTKKTLIISCVGHWFLFNRAIKLNCKNH